MRHRIAIAALLLSAGSAHALTVAAGCAIPSVAAPTRTLYVDPAKGSDANAGTQASPWKSVQGAKVKPGDAIMLMSGSYGNVKIDGLKLASFATVGAAPGQAPLFASLEMLGSSHWIVQGVKFQALASGYDPFLNVSGSASFGASSDIVFDGNSMASADDVSGWTPADWVSKGRYFAITVDGGDANSTYARCVTITNNAIKNVRYGIGATANDMLVKGNTIKNFGDDGLDFAGNRLVMVGNRITDNHDIGDNNHNDGIQGQIGHGLGGTTVYDHVTIDGNVVIAQETPGLKFPAGFQGISAFDMDWSNLTVTNNVVVVNAYHGVSFYSVHGGLIANNTVLGTLPAVSTWVLIAGKSHQGSQSDHVIVRNNISPYLQSDFYDPTVTFDHNLLSTQIAWWPTAAAGQFLNGSGVYGDHNTIDAAKFATTFAGYDPHLLKGSPAIGAGNGGVDLGAVPFAAAPAPTPLPATPGGFALDCGKTSVAGHFDCKQTITP